ncbi:MAG: response regulator transcription factor [Saprospiraceae bacterium]|nr:response regulator transcription factor [Saprospiraceae bacterium]
MKKEIPLAIKSEIEDLYSIIQILKNSGEESQSNGINKEEFDPEKLYLKLKSLYVQYTQHRNSHLINQLSQREKEIIFHLCEGNMIEEIAILLNISKHTVESHIPRITTKLQVRNSKELIAFAFRTGLMV